MTIHDFMSGLFDVQTVFASTMTKNLPVTFLPCCFGSYEDGVRVGWLLFAKDDKDDKTEEMSHTILPPISKEIDIQTIEELQTIVDDCESHQYICLSRDDPKRLRAGFLILKKELTYCTIKLSLIKQNNHLFPY